jgi:hypothetical protein
MHRRFLVPFVAVPVLLLALAAPALAAPPLKESGTQQSFYSYADDCSGSTCTQTGLYAYVLDAETLEVCLDITTFNWRNNRFVSGEFGCTLTDPSALDITAAFSVTLADTSITLLDCNRRGCTESRTVTVSAQDSAVGPVFSESSRGTFSDGTCTYRYSSSSQSAEIAGTMWIDGAAVDQWGYASISQYSVTTRCK